MFPSTTNRTLSGQPHSSRFLRQQETALCDNLGRSSVNRVIDWLVFKGEYRMYGGEEIDNWSKRCAIPLVLMLCLGTLCVQQAPAQVSPNTTNSSPIVIVNFVTTTATPLNPGFNGFNNNLKNAVEYYDTNFQQILTTLSPGWLRFPGGTDSEAFDWQSGEIVPAWVDALAANAYQYNINAAAQPIVAGKGGSSFGDFATMAANVGGAKIIVSVNAFTDTPQSAQAFAQYALTNHIPVAAWELANEPYTWVKFGRILHGCGRLRHQNEALPGCNQSC